MIVYMEWNARGYAPASIEDRERCESIKDAKDTFWRRADFDPSFPCVEQDGTEAYLYFGKDGKHGDYPDRRIYFGPRGGVRIERC